MKNRKLNITATALLAVIPLTASYAVAQSSNTAPQPQQSTQPSTQQSTQPSTQQSTQTPSEPGMQGGAHMDDAAITTKVKAAISADPQLTALKINVKTKQGVVVVSGTVPNAELNSHLLQVVSSVSGVRDVQNQLKIKGAT